MRNHALLYVLSSSSEADELELLAESNSFWPVLWRILFAQTSAIEAVDVDRAFARAGAAQSVVVADAREALQRYERVVRCLTRCATVASVPAVGRYLQGVERHLRDRLQVYELPDDPAPMLCADVSELASHDLQAVRELSAAWWREFELVEQAQNADASALLSAMTGSKHRLQDWRPWADGFGFALFLHPYFAESFREARADEYVPASALTTHAAETQWPHRHGFAVILRNERYGYVDEDGMTLGPAQFDEADDFTQHGVARVCRRRQYGLLRTDGSFAVPLHCDRIEWRVDLDGWLCGRGDACTLVHADGSTWINAAYTAIDVLVPGQLLRVRRGASVGALRWTGESALDCEYTSLSSAAAKDSSLLIAGKGDCMGVIDVAGREHVPFQFLRIEALAPHVEGAVSTPTPYLRVFAQSPRARPKAGVWDLQTSRLVVPCEYELVQLALFDRDGRFGFIVAQKAAYDGAPRNDRYRVGVIDASGAVVVAPVYAWLGVTAALSKTGQLERVREAVFWAWSRGEAVEAGVPNSTERVWLAANGVRTGAPSRDVATLRAPNSPLDAKPAVIAAAFYQFVELPDYEALRAPLLAQCDALQVKGTILLAAEGINGTISGTAEAVRGVLAYLRSDPRLASLEHKESPASGTPFYRMKVRLKREIVTMGVPHVNAARMAGTYVKPEDWNALIADPDVVVIDARNDYEVALGTFPGAINPQTRSFRELPDWLRAQAALQNKPKVAMFCTGGIRCEKSTAFLRSEGFDEVYHLQGGILKYLETVPEKDSRWRGECFVFDERVAIGHGLKPGAHELCRSCREPIDEDAKSSPLYVEGVSCPKCYHQRSDEKKRGLLERQRQVELAKQRNDSHIGVPQELKRQAKRQRRAT